MTWYRLVERAQKRVYTSDESGVLDETKKLTLPSIKDKLFVRPHLVNRRLFHNWWSRGSVKPILKSLRGREDLKEFKSELIWNLAQAMLGSALAWLRLKA